MRAYAKLILPLLCAAACTGAALADELPDLPEHGAEQPPAIAENQPADTETIEETPEVSDENKENGAIQPAEPDMDSGFLIEPEPEPEPPESTPEPEPETIVLTRFDTQVNVDVAAIACGDADALHAFFRDARDGLCGYDADGTPYDFFTGAWELSAVDWNTPGVYDAVAPLLLVDGEDRACFSLAEGVEAPMIRCRVSVQQTGKPEIGEFITARGQMIFPWVLTEEQKAQRDRFTVWLKRENGAWEALTRGISVGTDALKLYPQTCGLTSGTTCALQVEDPGGQTGILTFTYDVAPLKHGYSAGSRDGGGEDTYLPDIIQPSPGGSHSGGSHHRPSTSEPAADEPETPSEDAAQAPEPDLPADDESETPAAPEKPETAVPTVPFIAAPSRLEDEATIPTPPVLRGQTESRQPVQRQPAGAPSGEVKQPVAAEPAATAFEQDTADGAVLSGTRLLALIKLDEPLTLNKNGIAFSLPVDTLRALELTDADTLAVTLTRSAEGRAQAELRLNGEKIDLPDGMTLTTDEAKAPAEPEQKLPFAAAGAAVLAAVFGLMWWRKHL